MPRKKGPNKNIPDALPIDQETYVTWGADKSSRDKAIKEYGKSIEEFGLAENATAGRYRHSFRGIDGANSGRPGLTRSDYDVFRPDEAISSDIRVALLQCNEVYHKFGLVKNIIDLMGDFASQGIRIVNPNKKEQRFFQNWFKKVRGQERSERFLNTLYRLGTVVINRQTAKITLAVQRDMSTQAADFDITKEIKPEKREIPWKYTFINPATIEIVGGALASFVNNKIYAISLSNSLRRSINSPKNEAEKLIVDQLPASLIEAAKKKTPYPLDPNKTLVYHYKKDDWAGFSLPIIYSILDDVYMIDKLKLADASALDGAISNIRIFKLGNLEHKIAPKPAAAAKLRDVLESNVGGGTMDLVWGPDIELVESKTQVHQFLGEGKYTPHLNSIYSGLGIPPTLTGTFGASGTTNNFISLKTLTQRLQYGRRVLTEFWNNEIDIVKKALGFKHPTRVEFDKMDLSNEDAEKALLIQLADRNIVSDEIVQRVFGFDPEIEKHRLTNETKQRKGKKMPQKVGPYYDGNFENNVKKLALQLGIATVGQVGVELDEKQPGEKTALEMKAKLEPKKQAPSGPIGVSGQGRPKTKKDTSKRKAKKFAPRTGASLNLWALDAQEHVAQILNPILLDIYKKKNMRSLSNNEYAEAEEVKSKVFFCLKPFEEITEEKVMAHMSNINSDTILTLYKSYQTYLRDINKDRNKQLTADETRFSKAYLYSLVYNNQA